MSRLMHWLRSRRMPPPPDMRNIGRHRLAPPIVCELAATSDDCRALFNHVAVRWSMLGEIEPYWSVLSAPKFRAEAFAEHADEFYASEQGAVGLIQAVFARNGCSLSALTSCLELGCGVGRSTPALAQLFPQVAAVDVSASHLALARERLGRAGLANVSWHQVRSVEDFAALPRFDLLFSEIVLQHNPPPVIAAMLERLFAKLDPGGYCLFQLPTYREGYRFDVKSYRAASRPPDRNDLPRSMEMHLLPQRVVYRLMREAGIELIEVVEDNLTGHPSYQSMTFFARKTRPGA